MANENALDGAYLVTGSIGNVATPGAPVVDFSLVVVPSQNKVTGRVVCKQAVEGGTYSGNVEGKIYATGLGQYTQAVSLFGSVQPNGPEQYILPFNAHMAVDGSWNGTGGFNYGNVHVEDVPVQANN